MFVEKKNLFLNRIWPFYGNVIEHIALWHVSIFKTSIKLNGWSLEWAVKSFLFVFLFTSIYHKDSIILSTKKIFLESTYASNNWAGTFFGNNLWKFKKIQGEKEKIRKWEILGKSLNV